MKMLLSTFVLALFLASYETPVVAQGSPPPQTRNTGNTDSSAEGRTNYEITIQIAEGTGKPDICKVVTTEGKVSLNTDIGRTVQINGREIPILLDVQATLKTLESGDNRLGLFLGWSVPYETAQPNAGFQQMRLGLTTSVLLKLEKPLVIQSNANREITVTLSELK